MYLSALKSFKMKMSLLIIAILTLLVFLSQTYLIMAQTETQNYKVIKPLKDFEIRLYPAATMATVSMNANSYKELASPGFRKLAGYIFGGNDANTKIAMTTPVHMDINESQSSMSFVMPSAYTKGKLPIPNDSSVTIITTEEEYVAAITFSGYADDESIKLNATKLENSLKENGITYFGHFRFLGYNAPYQFVGRKNEIIVSVKWP
jgi:hypothetical protein